MSRDESSAGAVPTLRPDMKIRSSSDGAQVSSSHTANSRTLSTQTTLSSTSSHTSFPPPPLKEHRRALTFHFPRSRSKSPRPPPPNDLTTPATLKHAQTSPFPVPSSSNNHQRQRSDGIVSPSISRSTSTPISPDPLHKRDSWLQKKQRYSGSSPGGYGRHGDDWLFGGFSIRETAKEIVSRGSRKKEE